MLDMMHLLHSMATHPTHFAVSDPKVLYETPIRVFAPVADTPLSMCDYMFQGEATTDSMERFRELLDLVVEPDTIELDAERIPSMWDESTTVGLCRIGNILTINALNKFAIIIIYTTNIDEFICPPTISRFH